MKKWHQIAFLILVTALWSSNLFGQATASGTIQGTVTDNSGAVVVGEKLQPSTRRQVRRAPL
jgi:hypothetical protein